MSKINLRKDSNIPVEVSGVYLESQEEIILNQYNIMMKNFMDIITNYTRSQLDNTK